MFVPKGTQWRLSGKNYVHITSEATDFGIARNIGFFGVGEVGLVVFFGNTSEPLTGFKDSAVSGQDQVLRNQGHCCRSGQGYFGCNCHVIAEDMP